MPVNFPSDGSENESTATLRKALFGEKLSYSIKTGNLSRQGKATGILTGGNLSMNQTEKDKWTKMSDSERNKQLYTFDKPGKEKVITPEIRQEAFDNYSTTDDHSIHITGIAHDQNGTKYYLVKNSWNVTGNPYKGYFYASESFLRYKTVSIMVHKNAIPKDIAKKLGL